MFPAAATAAGQTALFYIGSREYIVDGVHYAMDAAPYIKDGRTFVPVRYAAQITGVGPESILFANGKVTLIKGDKVIQFAIGSNVLLQNGIPITMDAVPEITGGRTMLPFRWIGQALDTQVEWYPVNQMVVIRTDNQVGSQTSTQQPVTQPVIQVPQMEAPTGLRADVTQSGTGFQVTLSWNPVSGATCYNIYFRKWDLAQNSLEIFFAPFQIQYSQFTLGSSVGCYFAAGETWQFYVTAVGNGESQPSEIVQVTLPDTGAVYVPGGGVEQWQTYSDEFTGPQLQIEGPWEFINVVAQAIKLMREKSPDDYWFVINNLRKVRLDPGGEVKVGTGGNVDYKRVCHVSNRRTLTVYGMVSTMIHEANHVYLRSHILDNLNIIFNQEEEEKSCLRREITALKNIGAPQYLIDYKQKVHDNIKEYKWW
jgi:hypothetical protein